MIQLEQIQRLQERVIAAVHKIDALQHENGQLRTRTEQAEQRAAELQQQLDSHNTQYAQIEEGILHALAHLDTLEDAVSHVTAPVQSGGIEEGTVSDPEPQAEIQNTDDHEYDSHDEPVEQQDTPEAELDIF